MGDSKFQVGDFITIKQLRLEDDKANMYRFGLNSVMVALSGKSCKIKSVNKTGSAPGKLPDDGYLYRLEEDPGNWAWASSMFEGTIKDESTKGESTKDESNIDAFVNKKKCPVLDFTLH